MITRQLTLAEPFEPKQTGLFEQAARPTEILLALFAASSLAMIAVDQSGNVVALSRIAESLLGYATRSVHGQPGAMLLPALNRITPDRIERDHHTIAVRADGSLLHRRLMTTKFSLNDDVCWIIVLKPSVSPAAPT